MTQVEPKSQGDTEGLGSHGGAAGRATDVEVWVWQTRAEIMGVRTIEEPERRRGSVEPEGWKVEAQLVTLNSEVEPEQQWTKRVPEGRGSLRSLMDDSPWWS